MLRQGGFALYLAGLRGSNPYGKPPAPFREKRRETVFETGEPLMGCVRGRGRCRGSYASVAPFEFNFHGVRFRHP